MESFGHVFLIPSDGSQMATQGDSTTIWRAGPSGEELVSLMSSVNISGELENQRPNSNSNATSTESLLTHGCESTTNNKGKGEEALRGRRLPNVEQLLMFRSSTVQQQPSEALLDQVFPRQSPIQQTGRHQEGQHTLSHSQARFTQRNPSLKRVQTDVPPAAGSSGRGRQGEKQSSNSSASVVDDNHLALQTALVTMLHFQEQGDLQRKPVFPKRNLMCLSFLRLGNCPNRDTCNYAHNLTELQKKLELRRTSLCKYWLKGKCENEDCNFAHGEHELQSTAGVFKTTICKYWRQGCCYSGELCRHAHGEADLRPENLPPHLQRKKQQQHQYRLVGKSLGHRRERLNAGDEAIEGGLGRVRQKSTATVECMSQAICDRILSDSQSSLSAASFDSVSGEPVPTNRWNTHGSNSSDLSTDVFLSSASESPRGISNHRDASISSSSKWSLSSLSPEHSLAPVLGTMDRGCGFARLNAGDTRCSTEPALDSQLLMDLQHAFGPLGLPPSLLTMGGTVAPPPPPGLSDIGVVRGQSNDLLVGHCDIVSVEGNDGLSWSEKGRSRNLNAVDLAGARRSYEWPAAW